MRVLLAAFAVALLSSTAHAGDPKLEYKDPNAPPPVDEKKPTVWKANMTAGLVWLDGNSQSVGFSGSALVGVKHYHNELNLSGGGAYVYSGVSKYGTGGPITGKTNSAANWIFKARYDRYFLVKNTFFAAFQVNGDHFAGYWYRLEPQVGYARLFFQSVHQTFRGELGYDYSFEHRVRPTDNPDGTRPERDYHYHFARLFLFYENKFTPWASFSEGLEILEGAVVADGGKPPTENAFRLNSLTSLSSTIYKNVALKLNFKLSYNDNPAARPTPTEIDPVTMMKYVLPADQKNFEKVDTQLDLVLAVTFL